MKEKINKIIETLKSVGYIILGISFLIGLILLTLFILRGVLWIGEKALPFLINFTNIFAAISVFIFIPMTFLKKTRMWGGFALQLSSFLFGLTLWIYSALVVYMLWGFFGLFIGLFLAGVGVLPVAALASLFNGEWLIIVNLVYMIILTFGARFLGFYILNKAEDNKCQNLDENYYLKAEETCSHCGSKIKLGLNFCSKCGNKLI